MEDEQIKDNQITASSELFDAKYVNRSAAANGRANATIFSHHSAWIASAVDTDMWFEVNFLYNTTVKEILTQGRQHYDHWVKFYDIAFKNDTADVFQFYGIGDGLRNRVITFLFVKKVGQVILGTFWYQDLLQLQKTFPSKYSETVYAFLSTLQVHEMLYTCMYLSLLHPTFPLSLLKCL